jgi:hypothetical protein
MKYIELHNSNNYRQMNARPDDLPSLIQWLTSKLEEVPSEFHDSVSVEFNSNEGTCDVEECIYYFRPPTQEEITADLEDARIRKEKLESDERKKYEELKAKFEP